jgi:F0F1-type ATP synthase membrane subunit c/vacuolar-type H+-ATPase subunit K
MPSDGYDRETTRDDAGSEKRMYRGIAVDLCVGVIAFAALFGVAYGIGRLGHSLMPTVYANPPSTGWLIMDGLLTVALVLAGMLLVMSVVMLTYTVGYGIRSTWRSQ